MDELPKAQHHGMPSGRTSRLEPPANDLLAIHPACSGERHHQPCQRPHERKLGDQTKDDADKEPREEPSCGRSQTSLYNGRRPHSSLDDMTRIKPTSTFRRSAWRPNLGRGSFSILALHSDHLDGDENEKAFAVKAPDHHG